jgi:hypothetical protein
MVPDYNLKLVKKYNRRAHSLSDDNPPKFSGGSGSTYVNSAAVILSSSSLPYMHP